MKIEKLKHAIHKAYLDNQLETLIHTSLFILGVIVPIRWWIWVAIIAIPVGVRQVNLKQAFIKAGSSAFLAWLLLTLFFDILNGFRVSVRIGGLMSLPYPLVANLLTSVIGALLAMLFAGAAQQLTKTLKLMRTHE